MPTVGVGDAAVTLTRTKNETLLSATAMRLAYDGLGRRRLERKAMGVAAVSPFGSTSTIDVTLEYWANNVVEETTTVSTGPNVPVLLTAHAPASLDTPLWVSVGPTSAALDKHYTLATTARGDVAAAVQASLTGAASVLEEQYLDPYGEKEIVKRNGVANQYVTCVQGKENNAQSHPQQTCLSTVVGKFGLAGAPAAPFMPLLDAQLSVHVDRRRDHPVDLDGSCVKQYHEPMVTRTLQLPDDVDAALQNEATASGKSVNDVVNDVVRAFQERKVYLAALDEGIAEADRGDVLDGDMVFSALRAKLEGMRAANSLPPGAPSGK